MHKDFPTENSRKEIAFGFYKDVFRLAIHTSFTKEDWKIIFVPNSEKGSDSDDVSEAHNGRFSADVAFSRTFADQVATR
ncbi:hypothetical protein CEXT_158671 [Caerostris extrusa]|uniref:Uncharacterized protein n=1 Tax=Caerostris extrusa TaxID=172846 RepID=A0AAV4ULA3_CAEEX|nr:hypothetical protein CEXT_158671 [Caerostris extrusa]